MVGVDQTGAVGNEFVDRLEHRVGYRRARRFRQRVAAPTRVEAQADLLGRLELPVDDPPTRAAREAVLVIECGGATVLGKLCQRGERCVVEAVLGQPREDRIDQVQPLDDGKLRPVEVLTSKSG